MHGHRAQSMFSILYLVLDVHLATLLVQGALAGESVVHPHLVGVGAEVNLHISENRIIRTCMNPVHMASRDRYHENIVIIISHNELRKIGKGAGKQEYGLGSLHN
jgi:hypothetical protein